MKWPGWLPPALFALLGVAAFVLQFRPPPDAVVAATSAGACPSFAIDCRGKCLTPAPCPLRVGFAGAQPLPCADVGVGELCEPAGECAIHDPLECVDDARRKTPRIFYVVNREVVATAAQATMAGGGRGTPSPPHVPLTT